MSDLLKLIKSIAEPSNFAAEFSIRYLLPIVKKEAKGINPSFMFYDDLLLHTKCSFTQGLLLAILLDKKSKLIDPSIIKEGFYESGLKWVRTINKNKLLLESSSLKNTFYVYKFDLQLGSFDEEKADGHSFVVIQYFDNNKQAVRYILLQSYLLYYSLTNYIQSANRNEIQNDFSHEEFSFFLNWLEKIKDTKDWSQETEENYFKYFCVSKNLIGHQFRQGFIIHMQYGENTFENVIAMSQPNQEIILNSPKSFLIQYNHESKHKELTDTHFKSLLNLTKKTEDVCVLLTMSTSFHLSVSPSNEVNSFIEKISQDSNQWEHKIWHRRNLSQPQKPISLETLSTKTRQPDWEQSKNNTTFSNSSKCNMTMFPPKKEEPRDPLYELRKAAECAYNHFLGLMIVLPNNKDKINTEILNKLNTWLVDINKYVQACKTHNMEEEEILNKNIIKDFKKWNNLLKEIGLVDQLKIIGDDQHQKSLNI